jgi:hypothetical protein
MFVQGYENFQTQIDLQRQRSQKDRKKERLFVSKGKSLNFVFIDDPGIGIAEHRIAYNQNDFNNYYSCLGEICPLCHAGFNPTFISLYTTFDLTTWEKDGKKHRFSKRLFTPTGTDVEQLIKLRQNFGGSLKGAMMTLQKGSGSRDRAVITPYLRNGSIVRVSDEQLVKMVVEDGYKPELAKPLDYKVLFAPDSVEFLKVVMSRALLSKEKKDQRSTSPMPFESDSVIDFSSQMMPSEPNSMPTNHGHGVPLEPNIPDIPF